MTNGMPNILLFNNCNLLLSQSELAFINLQSHGHQLLNNVDFTICNMLTCLRYLVSCHCLFMFLKDFCCFSYCLVRSHLGHGHFLFVKCSTDHGFPLCIGCA